MDSYANSYLWKENKSDAGYKESWSDPTVAETSKRRTETKVTYHLSEK